MMKKILICILVLCASPAFGQQSVPSFGDIDAATLRMTSCPFEPDAVAMKLFDVQETSFDVMYAGFKLKMERHVRIKIFSEKGYPEASIKIPYLSKRGLAKIKELKAIIYNIEADGKITSVKLDKKDFFKEKANAVVGLVNFTFPGLRPGSVVEFSYTRIENDITLLEPWLIQEDIPCAYASLIMTTPVRSVVLEKLFGVDSVPRTVDLLKYDEYRRTTYYMRNVTSFHSEPYMTSRKDNVMKMIFYHIPMGGSGLLTNPTYATDGVWKAKGSSLMLSQDFGQLFTKPIAGTEKIIDSARRITSISARVKFIYDTVQRSIPQRTSQAMFPDDPEEAWKTRSGNSADINMVLLNLLKAANVTCFPLLVSTRENGRISKDYPSYGQMNGMDVVAVADSANYYIMDASLKFQPYNIPPFNILNREAYLLNPSNMGWFLISDKRPMVKQNINLFCEMKPDGLIEGEASLQHYNYAKAYILDTTIDEDDKNEESFFDKKTQGLQIISSKQELTDNDEDPLYQSVSFTYQPQQTDDFFFFNPRFLTSNTKNPFISEKRNTEIDFGCNQEVVLTINLTIPPDFEVDHLPKSVTVRAPDSSFLYSRSYTVSGQTVYMNQLFSIRRALFDKSEYAGLRESFSRMYALMNEEVVLRRKKKQ